MRESWEVQVQTQVSVSVSVGVSQGISFFLSSFLPIDPEAPAPKIKYGRKLGRQVF